MDVSCVVVTISEVTDTSVVLVLKGSCIGFDSGSWWLV